jgi:dihydrofolate reductase
MLALIVAVAKNNVIGAGNQLPWRMAADLKWFREKTIGHTVIMGRKTYESIGRPLPHRKNIVVTSSKGGSYPVDVNIANSLEHALELATSGSADARGNVMGDIFVIGGSQIYSSALDASKNERIYNKIKRIYLTRIEADIAQGDAFFPEVNWADWRLVEEHVRAADSENQFDCRFQIYEKK